MRINKLIRIGAIVFRNVLLGGNLISLSLVRSPRGMARYVTECLFLYKTFRRKRGIPEKSVFEVLPSNNVERIKLAGLDSGETWFNTSFASRATDIVNLCLICQIVKPKVVFEIGTARGYTSFHFALNTPNGAKIYSLDLQKNTSVNPSLPTTVVDDSLIHSTFMSEGYCFEHTNVASKINCLFGDSANFDFSDFYEKVDFFFIDGAHSYQYVRSDTLNALKCCHPGSIIAWHDFGRMGVNGVSKYLVELSKQYEIYTIPGGTLAFMVVK